MKANSERVRGKNFKKFGGKPLFRWMLDTLMRVQEIDQIVINTDARDLLAHHGLIDDKRMLIRDRRAEICGDLVSMNVIIRDDIENVDSDIYLMTHTTNPFLSELSIKRGIEKFLIAIKENQGDSLFTVNKVQQRFYNVEAKPINHDPENLIRTQDLEPWYQENSNLYLFTRESFHGTNARIGKRPIMLETDPFESTDIDTPDDWDLAEAMLSYYRQKGLLI